MPIHIIGPDKSRQSFEAVLINKLIDTLTDYRYNGGGGQMQIHIIGQGRLGLSLATILNQQSIPYTIHDRSFPSKLSGLVYICVPEITIADVAKQIEYHPDVCVLHASGSIGLEVFPVQEGNIGCLHPIQSFPGPQVHIPESIPATVLYGTHISNSAKTDILTFIKWVGFTVYPFTGNRLAYHTAAVLSGNFTTILFSLAKEVLKREGYSDEIASNLLYSLANQSLSNSTHGSLEEVLTGPIARGQTSILGGPKESTPLGPRVVPVVRSVCQTRSQANMN